MYGESSLLEADDFALFEDDELGLVGEAEDEDGDAFEDLLFEADFEGDLFFKRIWRGVKKVARKAGRFIKKGVRAIAKIAGPLLKKLAPIAAKIVGGVIGGPAGSAIAGSIASAVLREAAYESEGEAEAELADGEVEYEAAGGDPEAYELMEAHAAVVAEAENEADAEAGIARMAAHAARMFRANRKLRTAIPKVLKAAVALAKTFRRNPRTRWAVRTIPLIVKRSLTRLSRARAITPRAIVEAVARETAWVLANRRRASAALRRGAAARRRVARRFRRPRRRPRFRAPRRRMRRRIVRPRYCVL